MLLFDCLGGLVGFFKCFTQTIYSDGKLYVIKTFGNLLTIGCCTYQGKGSIMESAEIGGTIHKHYEGSLLKK